MANDLTTIDAARGAQPGSKRPRVLPEGPPVESPRLRALEAVLVALRRGVKDLGFYPASHPKLQQSLTRVVSHLRQILEWEDPLTFTVTREGITHQLGPVGKTNGTVKAFAAELSQLQIRRIHIGREFTPEELKAFLVLAGMDPKKLLMQGGPEAALSAVEVRNIQLNAVRFTGVGGDSSAAGSGGAGMDSGGEDSMAGMAASQGEELKEGTLQSSQDVAEGEGQVVSGSAQQADLLMQAVSAQLLIEEESLTLEQLLERLETAEGMEYSRLSRRLEAVARKAMETGDVAEFLRLAGLMIRHRDDSRRPPEVRLAATQWLEGMAQNGGPAFLAEELCKKEPDHIEKIMALLVAFGQAAVDPLIACLSIEESMTVRRRLIAAIVCFGDVALPSILDGFKDERWFVVRNMATLLAELGNESSLPVLGRSLRHQDHRVRRELARAIARIGGRHAVRLLRSGLMDSDVIVRQTCLAFLAAARDTSVLSGITAIATERARDKDGQELRKMAIQALGQIGDRSAVPLLVQLLKTRWWFRRTEPEEIRAAAATALGLLGGPQAWAALQRAQGCGGRLGQACHEALARLGA
jgi:HEAT repeat protein